ncbi:hypothetical protein INR49_026360 [Caranx melampygus]|nr:hypothetical protein INR49_026360 [Caranx melampygus]
MVELSLSAWAFMILSMLAVQPYARTRTIVNLDSERTSSRGLPGVLLIIIVFGDDNHLLSNKGLHEGLGARLGDGTQIVNQVSLGHADSSVNEGI